MHGPHRGQEFSVDDADYEIGANVDPRQVKQRQLKRQSSTLRRRPVAQLPSLPRVSSGEEEPADTAQEAHASARTDQAENNNVSSGEDTLRAEEEEDMAQGESPEREEEVDEDEEEEDDDDGDMSDAESFTLKDRQDAINVTHPFGIRIWKPALYKKDRSVQKASDEEIHSAPGGHVTTFLFIFNALWTVVFGWWLALIAFVGSLVCLGLGFGSSECAEYGKVLLGLAKYLFYPFGKYVLLMQDEAYADEDEGEGRSISEYEQWQSGDIETGRLFFGPQRTQSLVGRTRDSLDAVDAAETDSLIARTGRSANQTKATARSKRRMFGRGEWNVGRVIFFVFFYGLITPLMMLVCGICWLFVFTIPMGKVTMILFEHLRRHPLALEFHHDSSSVRQPGQSSSVLLCTYRAVGSRYWKYTIDGTNIFLINLLALVVFAIFDYFILAEVLHIDSALTNNGLMFALGLLSIIPLAYFIGQAVASISAQSSMGVGATINAFFSTVVEVYLYCIALNEGKAQLVEGSIIGSIFAGVLFLPGLSMCFGALKRKTQRFNVKSAGVTSTMLLFAVIGAFGPTLFYQIYGSVSETLSALQIILTENSMNSVATIVFAKPLKLMSKTVTVDAATSVRFLRCTIDSTLRPCAPTPGLPLFCSSCPTSSASCLHCVHMQQSSGPRVWMRRRLSALSSLMPTACRTAIQLRIHTWQDMEAHMEPYPPRAQVSKVPIPSAIHSFTNAFSVNHSNRLVSQRTVTLPSQNVPRALTEIPLPHIHVRLRLCTFLVFPVKTIRRLCAKSPRSQPQQPRSLLEIQFAHRAARRSSRPCRPSCLSTMPSTTGSILMATNTDPPVAVLAPLRQPATSVLETCRLPKLLQPRAERQVVMMLRTGAVPSLASSCLLLLSHMLLLLRS